jgi:hypothetical protein
MLEKFFSELKEAAGGDRSGCVTEPPQRQVPAAQQLLALLKAKS